MFSLEKYNRLQKYSLNIYAFIAVLKYNFVHIRNEICHVPKIFLINFAI